MRKFGTTSPFKNYQNRHHSPLRSPIRPTSPFRTSPFSRQPMSPLRSRHTPTKSVVTPTKYNTTHGFRRNIEQFQRSPHNKTQKHQMHKTIKNGMGLFQQLAQQHKLGSQRKQNKLKSYQTQPFEYSDHKSSTKVNNYPKNSFAALIQNVKEIQSIQASKGPWPRQQQSGIVKYGPSVMRQQNPSLFKQQSTNNYQLSFKTIQQSKQSKEQNLKSPPHRDINILESFGSPSPSILPEPSKKISEKSIQNSSFKIDCLREMEKSEIFEEEDSYSDVVFLINRVSEKKKQPEEYRPFAGLGIGDSVKVSFDEKSQSLNMSPFL